MILTLTPCRSSKRSAENWSISARWFLYSFILMKLYPLITFVSRIFMIESPGKEHVVITRRGFLQSCGLASLSLGLQGCTARNLPIKIDQQQYKSLSHLTFSGLITSLREEYDYEAEIEGSLPVDLRGTLYRNGVGLLERNGLRKRALMDGDGMVHAYFFHEHGVRFKNRFVQTDKFVAESAAGSYLYPTFSTQAPGGFLANIWGGGRIKSQAQISVVVWNNRLYAFDESNYPYEIDKTSLETIGVSRLGLPEGASLFAAHSKIDLHAREWMLFGLHYGRKVTLYTTIISENGNVLMQRSPRGVDGISAKYAG